LNVNSITGFPSLNCVTFMVELLPTNATADLSAALTAAMAGVAKPLALLNQSILASKASADASAKTRRTFSGPFWAWTGKFTYYESTTQLYNQSQVRCNCFNHTSTLHAQCRLFVAGFIVEPNRLWTCG
jgi:hypothetical protein